MESDILYNQIVTASDLNGIAVDLGATDFSVFTDGVPYAVDKLNEITSALVTSGIASALNKFEITINNDGIVINTGMAFFESGRKVKFETPLTIAFSAGELYLHEDISTGAVSIHIGELPTENYIHLATINEDKTFIDRRTFAGAKVIFPTCTHGSVIIKDEDEFKNLEGRTLTIPTCGIHSIFLKGLRLFEYDVSTGYFVGTEFDGTFSRYHTYMYLAYQKSGIYCILRIDIQEKTEEYVTFKFTFPQPNWNSAGVFELPGSVLDYWVFGGI